ncbi:hypothetical protein DWX58_04025 [Pseudoflavonifractor sp. AF19-9AC]|uniref:hypothetical protein n=1 Tax=Pseudoflavonifractor sp. AF19-9AC TaxID=2292244 RepID=UPI000E539D9C|nr:hypothetical protein [Pseudoflavonifractor sp. AF19-9AC]RHR10569.1 hypothetical protein DWX58_04025 [Pseudoflavonifractor sp. AF19-9AC]
MTSEHLLEAMGLLDDDLIVQAEQAPARKPVPWQRWLGLCACLALVLLVGRGVVQNWSGINSSNGAGASTSAGGGAPSGDVGSAGTSSGSVSLPDGSVYILLDNRSYLSTEETVPELPDGAEEVGLLSEAAEGASSPSTNGTAYVGCALYAGADGLLYVQSDQGDYEVFALAEPSF